MTITDQITVTRVRCEAGIAISELVMRVYFIFGLHYSRNISGTPSS